jgi:hypothetical protein
MTYVVVANAGNLSENNQNFNCSLRWAQPIQLKPGLKPSVIRRKTGFHSRRPERNCESSSLSQDFLQVESIHIHPSLYPKLQYSALILRVSKPRFPCGYLVV